MLYFFCLLQHFYIITHLNIGIQWNMGNFYSKRYSQQIKITSSKFKSIKELFCLQDSNISEFYELFRKIDRHNRSFIDLDDFVDFFKKQHVNFVELPYAQRLFKCMQKQKQGKIFFEQFVKGLSAFCLLNNESVLHFIFDLIDTDGDQRISKQDINKLIEYRDPENDEYTFFINFLTDLQRFPMKENQSKMDFDHFRINSDKLLFLIWPAFNLQQILRQLLMGKLFWFDLYGKAQKKELQIKNNEKKEQRLREKVQIIKTIKVRKVDGPFYKEIVNERTSRQVSDDCRLLKRAAKSRRKSAIYLKNQLQLKTNEQNDQS